MLREQICKDPELQVQFDFIIANKKLDFNQKVDQLKDLCNYLKKQQEIDFNTQMVKKRVKEITRVADQIEETNQRLCNEIESYKFESMYGEPIPNNESRAINIFNLLEQTRLDSVDQTWTKDELEHFSGDLWLTTD